MESDMAQVAQLIDESLQSKDDDAALLKMKQSVREFSLKFPVPGIEA
jgi:glycine/serine hydroxymethyltransferase